jgi:hypothetical protein
MEPRRWLGLCLSLGFLGCTSTESRCETLCEFSKKCPTGGASLDCSEAGIDKCVDDYDAQSERCQDALDELADCIDEEDQSCSGVQSQCEGEATEVFAHCRRAF